MKKIIARVIAVTIISPTLPFLALICLVEKAREWLWPDKLCVLAERILVWGGDQE